MRPTLAGAQTVRFHFDDNLGGLLSRGTRGADVQLSYNGPQSAKYLVESLGIPHTELGVLLRNGHEVDLGYLAQDGAVLEVFASALKDGMADEPRFALDCHLGRLTA